MPTYHIESEEIQGAADWLRQNMDELLRGMTTAKGKIDTLIQSGYSTPKARAKFGPHFDEYKRSVDETLRGMEGISKFLKEVGTAFENTDDQTTNKLS